MSIKYILGLLSVVLLVGIFGYVGYVIFVQVYNFHPFILGDWLISYEDGGFRRRGLSGELFFFLQDSLGGVLPFWILCMQWLCLAVLATGVFSLLTRNIKKEPLYFLLFLLPTTLFFWINDIMAVGRKEIILLAIFSMFTVKKYEQTYAWIYGVLLGISTLFHELTIFFLPYFLWAIRLVHGKVKRKAITFIILPSFISFLAIYLFGDVHFSNGNVMNILRQRGVYMDSVLIDFKDPAKFSLLSLVKNYMYAIPIAYTFVVLFLYEYLFKEKIIVSYVYILAIILSMPLFLLASDWGRWIFVHSMMSVLLLTHTHTHTHTQQNRCFGGFLRYFYGYICMGFYSG